jgi:ubiquinone/menaquinone biosynthesis C-methylase UbiE
MSPAESHVEKIRRQFSRQAKAYAEMQQTRDEKPLRGLVALAGVSASDRVLDVACGPGFLTLAFAEKCRGVVGVDATEELLGLARREAARRRIENATFVQGDATRLELGEGPFDLASCRAAFHHFPEPARVVREMIRVVKPGGKLLIADMLGSEDPEKATYHDRIETLCDPTHTRALPESEFDALFREAGLEILQRPTSELDYEVEEWLEHGGPGDQAAAEIRTLLEASIERDLCGLRVRREGEQLHFSHRAAAFLLRTPSA